jgi:hypothetical protein
LFAPASQQLHRTSTTALNFDPLLAGGSADGFAIGVWNGDVYAIDADGKPRWHSPVVKGYFDQANPTKLLVSEHGDVVEFAFGPGENRRFRISLYDATVGPPRFEAAPLRPPILTSPRIKPRDLNDFTRATVNGNRIKFDRWEETAGSAIAPNDSALVIGSRFALRKIGPDGRTIWKIDPGSEVWAVNVSGDNRFAIAALGDGTIRWYGMKDGGLALSLFVHADGKRWAAWTPAGQFYAPQGSEDLVVGYLPGTQAPVPPEVLRDGHYRRDLLDIALSQAQ